MNFTREPIIETVISPKDGFKLLVRSSKGGDAEEYYVDAVEVVCFGRAFFFRSLEKPKAFLVPVSDYEVLEVKETRVALKNVSHERNIKIGGGREGFGRQREKEAPPKEDFAEVASEQSAEESPAQEEEEVSSDQRTDRRRDRRRHRRRRSSDGQQWSDRNKPQESQEPGRQSSQSDSVSEGGGAKDETKVSSSMFSTLLPPPTTLISQTLSRYKDKEAIEGGAATQPPQEEKEKNKPLKEDKPQGEDFHSESSPLNRVLAPEESGSFTTTHFSSLDQGFLPPF